MGEEHEASGAEAGAEPPHFMSGLKGIVAGITSAVVAITALLAALTNLFGNHGPSPARAVAGAPAELVATPEPAAAADDGNPTRYTGKNSDGQNIEVDWDGKHWVYTDPDASYVYADLTSDDTDMVLAYDREIDGYLRWPVQGGAIEESFKSQLEFKPIGMLKTSAGN